MRTLKYFILLSVSIALISFANSKANHSVLTLSSYDSHFVVVIGAFVVKENAKRFVKNANDHQYNASYEFNPDRNLYYVFTLTTENKEQAMAEARRLREETIYTDSWVYQGSIGAVQTRQNIDPVTEQKIEEDLGATEALIPAPEIPLPVQEPLFVPEGKKFFFKTFRSTDNKIVNGDVEAIDVDRTRKMGSYKTNSVIYLPSPKNNSGKVTLVAKAFGYRNTQLNIDYLNPVGDNISVDGNNGVVIPFELIRLRKGDIVVMYNVFFYIDAAVMMPESRYEVDALLNMMLENSKCKIRIHGHTNGNASGKIITQGDSKSFFSLTDTKEGFGSAKALSEARANIIRDFLIDGGVEPQRMEVKSWGGKKSIHDKDSPKAKENVRVEVEIMEE